MDINEQFDSLMRFNFGGGSTSEAAMQNPQQGNEPAMSVERLAIDLLQVPVPKARTLVEAMRLAITEAIVAGIGAAYFKGKTYFAEVTCVNGEPTKGLAWTHNVKGERTYISQTDDMGAHHIFRADVGICMVGRVYRPTPEAAEQCINRLSWNVCWD